MVFQCGYNGVFLTSFLMFFFCNIFSVYHVVLRLEAYTKEYL